eukprot:2214337-Rhodomonas_salina.1
MSKRSMSWQKYPLIITSRKATVYPPGTVTAGRMYRKCYRQGSRYTVHRYPAAHVYGRKDATRIPGSTRLPYVVTAPCTRQEQCTIGCNRCDSSSGLHVHCFRTQTVF